MTRPPESPASPWWSPARHRDRRPFLAARAAAVRAVRRFFEERDFTEVEAGVLQVSPGAEAHLHAFATEARLPDGRALPLYLHTSPEFACKKLLAAGETRIFTLGPVFRNRERGALHAPEFTMLEWYRAGEDPDALMADCAALLAATAAAVGAGELRHGGASADPFLAPERLSVAEAFLAFANIDLLATLGPDPARPPPDELRRFAEAEGIRTSEDDSWSDVFSRILSGRVEPELGLGRATILHSYPVSEAALARVRHDDPRLADRFELYACGVELANAFGELTDAVEQRRRAEAAMDDKARLFGERHPLDEDFLAALAVMPAASGAALGLDRLVMLLTGAARIEQVRWTPFSHPALEG